MGMKYMSILSALVLVGSHHGAWFPGMGGLVCGMVMSQKCTYRIESR